MKKFKGLLVLLILFVITGCSLGNSPKSKVEALLMKYQTNSADLKTELDDFLASINAADDYKDEYRKVYERQYKDLKYKIKDEKIDVKILVLTVHNEVEYLLKAVDIGINGYLLKDSESSELKKAILSVVDGEDYIQPSLIPVLNAKMIDRDMDSEKIEKLTKRELEVLKLLAVGMYNKGVADELHISERTVKNHVSSIFKKIDSSDRTQAAVFAIRNGLVDIK